MKKCPYCGFENGDGDESCKRCFAPIEVKEPETNTAKVGRKNKKEMDKHGT